MEFLDKNGVKHLLTKIKSATEEISRGGVPVATIMA